MSQLRVLADSLSSNLWDRLEPFSRRDSCDEFKMNVAEPALLPEEMFLEKLWKYTSFSAFALLRLMHHISTRATEMAKRMAPTTAPTAMNTMFLGASELNTYGFLRYEPSSVEGGTVISYEYEVEDAASVRIPGISLESARLVNSEVIFRSRSEEADEEDFDADDDEEEDEDVDDFEDDAEVVDVLLSVEELVLLSSVLLVEVVDVDVLSSALVDVDVVLSVLLDEDVVEVVVFLSVVASSLATRYRWWCLWW